MQEGTFCIQKGKPCRREGKSCIQEGKPCMQEGTSCIQELQILHSRRGNPAFKKGNSNGPMGLWDEWAHGTRDHGTRDQDHGRMDALVVAARARIVQVHQVEGNAQRTVQVLRSSAMWETRQWPFEGSNHSPGPVPVSLKIGTPF